MALRRGELLVPWADPFLGDEIWAEESVSASRWVWREELKARIRVGQWLARGLLRPQWPQLVLNSLTAWPWLGQAALRWSRGRKDI